MLVITATKAQVMPNAGFETWTSMGTYSNPSGWGNYNNSTSPASVFTCEKGTPGNVGTAYLKLTSKTVTGFGVAPGIAVSGVIDSTNGTALSGFAYATRSALLTGKWQHMISGSSQGFIDVKLTRWDGGTSTASAHVTLSGMAMSWANFSIPLTYTDSNNPDSCIIVLAASGSAPANGDYLWVDALAFSGTQGISENLLDAAITVFPNPSSDMLHLDLAAFKDQKLTVQITDMSGKLIKSMTNIAASSKVTIGIADLSDGNYILNVISKEGTASKKFIKK